MNTYVPQQRAPERAHPRRLLSHNCCKRAASESFNVVVSLCCEIQLIHSERGLILHLPYLKKRLTA
jgi:hypothetical protein